MENNTVQIEITEKILASLIEGGLLHAVDFKCLDVDSKKTVWKLLLTSSLGKRKP